MKVGDIVTVVNYKTLYEYQGKLLARWDGGKRAEDYRGKTGVVFEYENLYQIPELDPDIVEIDLPEWIYVKFDDGFIGNYTLEHLIKENEE